MTEDAQAISTDFTVEFKTGRIEALSDGIFAIAMTILILSFEVLFNANPGHPSESAVRKMLFDLWPDFIYYVLGFIILSIFWIEHHSQFHFIKRTDIKLLFINIFGLMSVAIIPFTTVMVGDYNYTRVGALLFETSLFVTGMTFFVHWMYAVGNCRLVDACVPREVIVFYRNKNLLIPVVSLLAAAVSFFIDPAAGTGLYFVVPILLPLFKIRRAKSS
ncbi:MAG: DUF1211 domain-containing protein [Candidatus Omnitrophica bacterium]|nr:DUF1211 domain-containing protein [Candidatus Omnitrophota bacterium]